MPLAAPAPPHAPVLTFPKPVQPRSSDLLPPPPQSPSADGARPCAPAHSRTHHSHCRSPAVTDQAAHPSWDAGAEEAKPWPPKLTAGGASGLADQPLLSSHCCARLDRQATQGVRSFPPGRAEGHKVCADLHSQFGSRSSTKPPKWLSRRRRRQGPITPPLARRFSAVCPLSFPAVTPSAPGVWWDFQATGSASPTLLAATYNTPTRTPPECVE